jgi:hypothetical protein
MSTVAVIRLIASPDGGGLLMGVVDLDVHHAGPEAASGWLTSR